MDSIFGLGITVLYKNQFGRKEHSLFERADLTWFKNTEHWASKQTQIVFIRCCLQCLFYYKLIFVYC